MQRKFLSGGGISQIYPPPEGAVDSRVRSGHRDYRPGCDDSRPLGLVGNQEPVQHGGGSIGKRDSRWDLGTERFRQR